MFDVLDIPYIGVLQAPSYELSLTKQVLLGEKWTWDKANQAHNSIPLNEGALVSRGCPFCVHLQSTALVRSSTTVSIIFPFFRIFFFTGYHFQFVLPFSWVFLLYKQDLKQMVCQIEHCMYEPQPLLHKQDAIESQVLSGVKQCSLS